MHRGGGLPVQSIPIFDWGLSVKEAAEVPAASVALSMPRVWEKMALAICTPDTRLVKQMKNWNMVYPPLAIRLPPYQKASAVNKTNEGLR